MISPVVGDRRKFIAALFTLEPTALIAQAQAIGSPARDAATAAKDPIYLKWLNQQVHAYHVISCHVMFSDVPVM